MTPSRRWFARAAIACAALATTVLVPLVAGAAVPPGGTTAPAQRSATAAAELGAVVPDPSQENLSLLGSCLVDKQAGDVVMMLDDSGSIRSTDPTGARIDAAKNLVGVLAAKIADPQNALHGVKLTVAVASFGEAVRQDGKDVDPLAAKWTPLDNANTAGLKSDIETYRSSLNGKETDYWTALNWIIGAENAHNGGNAAAGCHLVLWFTDGQYQILNRDNGTNWGNVGPIKITPWTPTGTTDATTKEGAAAIQAGGANDICRARGLADQIRADHLTLAAIGLGKDDNSNLTDFDLLKRIALNPTGDCGQLAGTGLFEPVHAGTLLLAFDALGNSGGSPIGVEISKVRKFTLDSSLRRVHVAAAPQPAAGSTAIPALTVQIQGPGGGVPVEIPPAQNGLAGLPGTAEHGDVNIAYQWLSAGELTIDMTRPVGSKAWDGGWSITFIDKTGKNPKALAATQITLSADLALTADPTSARTVHAGDTYKLPLQLQSQSGDAPEIGEPPPRMTYDVQATAAGGTTAVQVGHGTVTGTTATPLSWAVPAKFAVGNATVTVTLTVSSKSVPAGELDPVVRQFQLAVRPVVGVGTVTATAVDFGTVEGTKTGKSSVGVVGPGCFWAADGAMVTAPQDVTKVAIGSPSDSESNCLQLTAGQQGTLGLTATPGDPANGTVTGLLTVHFEPLGRPDKAGQTVLTYQLKVKRPIETSVFWVVLAITIIVGLGLPVAVLWFTRRFAARFPRTISWSATRVPIRVGPRAIMTAAGAQLFLADDWVSVPPAAPGRRSVSAAGLQLRARTGPLWSSEAGYTEIEGRPGVGSGSPHFSAKNLTAQMPLSVQGSWAIVVQNPAQLTGTTDEISAELLLVIHANADTEARQSLLREAMQDGPGSVTSLRDAARTKLGATSSNGPVDPAPPGWPEDPEGPDGLRWPSPTADGSNASEPSHAGGWPGRAGGSRAPAPVDPDAPSWPSQPPSWPVTQ